MTRLRILGTGNAQAVECYNTCLAIENENGTMIVDAGGGNGILKILERENIELSNIHDIFVTHAHSDHIFGIFWLIRRIGETMNKGKMDGILTLYAHKELADFIIYVSKTILPNKVTSLFGDRIIFSIHEDRDERTIIGNKFTVFDLGSTKMKQSLWIRETSPFPKGTTTWQKTPTGWHTRLSALMKTGKDSSPMKSTTALQWMQEGWLRASL